jgi:hypothetical protein
MAQKKLFLNHRKRSVKKLSNGKRTITQTYHGNWHGITTYMKGHV